MKPFEQLARALSQAHQARLKAALRKCASLRAANQALLGLTGIRTFFETEAQWRQFAVALAGERVSTVQETAREYGDFQTPISLARTVCRKLYQLGCRPTVLVEPTCGRGNFVVAALETFPSIRSVYALDIQERYVAECKATLLASLLDAPARNVEIQVVAGNIFDHVFPPGLARDPKQQVLLLGNPPWVTNATLSQLDSANLPRKSNFKKHGGLDAMTGKSNFDIAEFILLHLIRSFAESNATLAMLCKNTVVRNLVQATRAQALPIKNMQAFPFAADREFGVACDASLFVADIAKRGAARTCAVANLEHSDAPQRTFGWVENQFVADVARYANTCDLDGASPLTWRQGLKHDCARVMELDATGAEYRNGLGQIVPVEPDCVYPLIKSSDLKTPVVTDCRKAVIVTQHAIGEDTRRLRQSHPRLWRYLQQHADAFEARRSSIYKGKPPFAMFGMGDYSFKPYKIAASGLYKTARFALVPPIGNKPVMLDDTCYLLGFDALEPALVTLALLNSQRVRDFLQAIVFLDSKRPYTKDILMRIDLGKVADGVSVSDINAWLRSVQAPRFDLGDEDLDFLRPERTRPRQESLALEKRAHYAA